jgi:hypothetical protein
VRYGALGMPRTGIRMVALRDVPCVPAEAQVTRPATDDTGTGSAGRAKKRIPDLLHDAWEVREIDGGWLIRAPMDQDRWQHWARRSGEWAELLEKDLVITSG